MDISDQLLFSWSLRNGDRNFIIDVSKDGSCTLFDEVMRRRCTQARMTAYEVLFNDIEADAPSDAKSQKMEFGVSFKIDEEHLRYVQQARQSFDKMSDVPKELERLVNQRFNALFEREVAPYLTGQDADLG